MTPVDPSLDVERELWRSGRPLVVGCDEVGRGALAGPVAVGMSVVSDGCGPVPDGLRDSKLLSESRRESIIDAVEGWVQCSAVGWATNDEIDELGIMRSLGLAGARAIARLGSLDVDLGAVVVLLDGSHDWVSPALRAAGSAGPASVVTRVKGDRDCASIAAASVIAKVRRDRFMAVADQEHPGYGWAANKGYGSAAHREAISRLGPSPLHRRSWLRPGDESGIPSPPEPSAPTRIDSNGR